MSQPPTPPMAPEIMEEWQHLSRSEMNNRNIMIDCIFTKGCCGYEPSCVMRGKCRHPKEHSSCPDVVSLMMTKDPELLRAVDEAVASWIEVSPIEEPDMKKRQKYETDIVLGERYVDKQTGIEGTATSVIFFQHGCERVNIETVINQETKDYSFDAPRLTSVKTGETATTLRTGGNRPSPSPASGPSR